MNDSTNPYEPPGPETHQSSFRGRDGFRSVLVLSGLGSPCAIGLALLFDTENELIRLVNGPSPGAFVALVPGLVAAFAAYFWTARYLPLPDGNHRSVVRASFLAICGIATAAMSIAAGMATGSYFSNLQSSYLSADESFVRLAIIAAGIFASSCCYSLVYASVHRVMFRRSRFLVLVKILFSGMALLIVLILGVAPWVITVPPQGIATYFTVLSSCLAHANCLAWWLSESHTRVK